MIELSAISKLGFGTYRVSSKIKEHITSLQYALAAGCNLIDTATGYTNGDAERMIGHVLSHQGLDRRQVFIISKVGYAVNDDLKVLNRLKLRHSNPLDSLKLGDDLNYSIDPLFIKEQISQSLDRMGTGYIDAFLLHNPEYYLKQNHSSSSKKDLYARIRKAFELLEEEVKHERIRYYGISSNTLPLHILKATTLSLPKILSIAHEVSSDHHFRFIQFPYNILEREASQKIHAEEKTLLTLAKAKQLVTLGNRPLNTKGGSQALRLTLYPEARDNNGAEAWDNYEDVVTIIENQLDNVHADGQIWDFEVMDYLKANWRQLTKVDHVHDVFNHHFHPFVQQLFEGEVPKRYQKVFDSFESNVLAYTKMNSNEQVIQLRASLEDNMEILKNDPRPFSTALCERYLSDGLDHVLIGMRHKKYVDALRSLF